mmetsp:Transcript_23942/g.27578  ORF Transcript_23942/g.27578 Transcript_23942/m.27578 type:complete len:80 (-) Transcript_23942:101-340(-)
MMRTPMIGTNRLVEMQSVLVLVDMLTVLNFTAVVRGKLCYIVYVKKISNLYQDSTRMSFGKMKINNANRVKHEYFCKQM